MEWHDFHRGDSSHTFLLLTSWWSLINIYDFLWFVCVPKRSEIIKQRRTLPYFRWFPNRTKIKSLAHQSFHFSELISRNKTCFLVDTSLPQIFVFDLTAPLFDETVWIKQGFSDQEDAFLLSSTFSYHEKNAK